MSLLHMIDELEDLVREAYEVRGEARDRLAEVPPRGFNAWLESKVIEAEQQYQMYVDALELLRRRLDDIGQDCITSNIFTLVDAIHNGASVNEIFYGGNNTDGEIEEAEANSLRSYRYDAGLERQNQAISFA